MSVLADDVAAHDWSVTGIFPAVLHGFEAQVYSQKRLLVKSSASAATKVLARGRKDTLRAKSFSR
jgi:hypothetical protein